MRKRSSYRPKHVLVNPVGYVLESLSPVASHTAFMLDLKIKNHAALEDMTKGRATVAEVDTLIAMANITEAFARLGFGSGYSDIVRDGLDALRSVGARGAPTSRFILKANEMYALNQLMELHDAQLEAVTLKDMDKAIALVREEHRLKKTNRILEKNA